MLCSKPFRAGVAEFGCGQCMPCRLNMRRVWTARLLLEQQQHESSSFVTLTYSDEHLPTNGSLDKFAMANFVKRLRFRLSPNKVRYFGVGEYGDITFRPHYHLALFGTDDADSIRASWKFGHVHVGTLTRQSAQYICGYVTKRMTSVRDERLQGRYPEFARMSLKPGIGGDAIDPIGSFSTSEVGSRVLLRDSDVPAVIRADGAVWPLGRYLRSRIRMQCGIVDGKQPQSIGDARELELVNLYKTPDGRIQRENQRLQDARRAKARVKISQSKKGVGI